MLLSDTVWLRLFKFLIVYFSISSTIIWKAKFILKIEGQAVGSAGSEASKKRTIDKFQVRTQIKL